MDSKHTADEVYNVIIGSLGGLEGMLIEIPELKRPAMLAALESLFVKLVQTVLDLPADEHNAALESIRVGDIKRLKDINFSAALTLVRVNNFAQSIYWTIQEAAYKAGDKIRNKVVLLMATQQAQACLVMANKFDPTADGEFKKINSKYEEINPTVLNHKQRMEFAANASSALKGKIGEWIRMEESAVAPAVPTGEFREAVVAAVVPPGAPKKAPKETSATWADMVEAPVKALTFAPAAAGAGEKKSWASVAATK
jgi:hypothetical protein